MQRYAKTSKVEDAPAKSHDLKCLEFRQILCCNPNPGLFDLLEDAEAHSISEIASDIYMEKKNMKALSQDG